MFGLDFDVTARCDDFISRGIWSDRRLWMTSLTRTKIVCFGGLERSIEWNLTSIRSTAGTCWAAVDFRGVYAVKEFSVETEISIEHSLPKGFFNELSHDFLNNRLMKVHQMRYRCTRKFQCEQCIQSNDSIVRSTNSTSAIFIHLTRMRSNHFLQASSKDTTPEQGFLEEFSIRSLRSNFRQPP